MVEAADPWFLELIRRNSEADGAMRAAMSNRLAREDRLDEAEDWRRKVGALIAAYMLNDGVAAPFDEPW